MFASTKVNPIEMIMPALELVFMIMMVVMMMIMTVMMTVMMMVMVMMMIEEEEKDEVLAIHDINMGDFALVRYKYSHSIKRYIGECMEKDNDGDISLIFLGRVCGSLFKYRQNIVSG